MTGAAQGKPPHRFVALDSLRGLAATGVFVTHFFEIFGLDLAPPVLVNGHVLVDLFFVLSGFVILESYGDKLRSGFSVKQFMLLRLGRIYPLHFVAIIVMLGLATVRHFARPEFELATWGEIVRAVFLLDGFRAYSDNSVAPVSWSLSVELGLYVVCALVLSAGSARRILAALTVCVVAGLLAMVWLPDASDLFVRRGLVSFGLGALCHVVYRRGWLTPSAAAAGVLEVGLVAGLFVVMSIPGVAFGHLLLVQASFAVLVFVMAHDAGAVSRLLQRPSFVFLGLISYSIYLMHLVAINGTFAIARMSSLFTGVDFVGAVFAHRWVQLVALVGIFPVVVGLSALTFFLVEKPARDWSRARAAAMGARAAERVAPTI